MDELTQKTFDAYLKILPSNLMQHQIDFLRARQSYMTKAQREEFASVLEDKPKPKKSKTNKKSK